MSITALKVLTLVIGTVRKESSKTSNFSGVNYKGEVEIEKEGENIVNQSRRRL
jgi:hypothetical protein